MTGTWYHLEVRPRIPERLARLEELACDLYYSWSSQTRHLFVYLDLELWDRCGHNPKLFLRRVAQQRLDEVVHDHTFMEGYNRALSEYDTYMQETPQCGMSDCLVPGRDLVAYFCLEFGFHESVPIYSGGLGILAGDHCKAASDFAVPLVAVGLLYRHGYFNQEIDRDGSQIVHFKPTDFSELLIEPVPAPGGGELRVTVELPGRQVQLKVWKAKAGKVDLFLLDSDIPENSEQDRAITYELYGGDARTRIFQEIVLGIGGTRALRAMGHVPTVWHINEGHAAFSILERCREHVDHGLGFDAAWELAASGTVFTTHTPVPAGHDVFSHELVSECLGALAGQLGIGFERFFALGSSPGSQGGFNMTALALRGSRFHNGVSRIHGRVASEMEGYIWPEVPHDENPIGYVTNGVHLPTFLSSQWRNFFDMHLGGKWRNQLLNPDYWECIDTLPDYAYWGTRQALKTEMLKYVRKHALRQFRRNGNNPVEIERLTRYLSPERTDVLILGFARRFATYKRATLLFRDPERLARLLGDPERPVLILFAGKAHPSDIPGQELIRAIHELSMRREFQGRILLLEDYNLALGRWLVTGVDVWLNTPQYPLEASGTSGEKAGINGVINLSVLDGWWGEAYDGDNGWAITPDVHNAEHAARDDLESQALLDLLEEEVIPLYFQRQGNGYSDAWVRKSKASMKTIIPQFNAGRMMRDYIRDLYLPAAHQCATLSREHARGAQELADWKNKVLGHWAQVQARRIDEPLGEIYTGEHLPIRVAVTLGGLSPRDLVVECLVNRDPEEGKAAPDQVHRLQPLDPQEGGEVIFALDLAPSLAGLQHYQLRLYPFHPMLSHPHETGFMRWV